ncbi:MAG: UDP-glucose/GDP-mannose dehydrogenase family protein [Candidatus Eremiobacteraeota bacterium]|nr:UDP-glucose/GDP-mannose dehydrogenase family protein [Candidatus Eremiobacteraeota bacterium]
MTIGVSGLWHLGCVLCASWAQLDHRVIGFDLDEGLLGNLRQGKPPIYEPGLQEGLEHPKVSWAGSIQDLAQCDLVFVAIDTPVDDEDRSLTACLEEQMALLGPLLPDGALVVVSSQSPVGFCRRLRGLLQDHNATLELAYSPENLRLGEALRCYREPGTVVIGTATAEVAERCRELFAPMQAQLLCMSLESAEMAKHGINTFLAMSIVYTNELANLCEQSGADVSQVVQVMKSDPRIGARAYLEPGVGFSGGTLGRDLRVLGAQGGEFFEELWRRNADRKNHIVRRLGSLAGKRIGVLGLTYKPGTSTLRRSLPLAVVCDLQAAGAVVRAYDPKADFSELPPGVEVDRVESPQEAAREAEILLLLTAWPEFLQLDWAELAATMKEAILFDCKNCLRPSEVERAGFTYWSLGR